MWISTDSNRAAPRFTAESAAKAALKAPVYLYHSFRYTLSPLIGQHCRHVPSCSQYALDAIECNGAWAGGWLTLFRLSRCHPWGTSGFDPAPDVRSAGIPFWAPWRYRAYRPCGCDDHRKLCARARHRRG